MEDPAKAGTLVPRLLMEHRAITKILEGFHAVCHHSIPRSRIHHETPFCKVKMPQLVEHCAPQGSWRISMRSALSVVVCHCGSTIQLGVFPESLGVHLASPSYKAQCHRRVC